MASTRKGTPCESKIILGLLSWELKWVVLLHTLSKAVELLTWLVMFRMIHEIEMVLAGLSWDAEKRRLAI